MINFHGFSTNVQKALRKCHVYIRGECKAHSRPLTTHDRLNFYTPARRACLAWLCNGVTLYSQIIETHTYEVALRIAIIEHYIEKM
jgi:hypothetical protein